MPARRDPMRSHQPREMMMSQTVTMEHKIRMLAYGIWLGEGCPHGRDLEHWLAAERTLMSMNPETVTGENQNAPSELAKSVYGGDKVGH